MKAFAIVIKDHELSETAFVALQKSSVDVGNDFDIEKMDAITYKDAFDALDEYEVRWKWPTEKPEFDLMSGLLKVPYPTINPLSRVACALSHYSIWREVSAMNEPVMILEHDAMFIRKLDDIAIPDCSIIGLNDPRGATRKSSLYHDEIQRRSGILQTVPEVDRGEIPQGLAGNSAYIITPDAADWLLGYVDLYGLWPNDAFMCRQLFTFLRVTKIYYTKVQGLPSTTSL